MTKQIEIWIAMDDEGTAAVGVEGDESEAEVSSRLFANFGGSRIRTVKLKVRMTPPQITEAEVDVPDEAGTVSATVA